MKITPITPTYRTAYNPRRATMSVRHTEHTVTDKDGNRFTLPPEQAWELLETLNGTIVTVDLKV